MKERNMLPEYLLSFRNKNYIDRDFLCMLGLNNCASISLFVQFQVIPCHGHHHRGHHHIRWRWKKGICCRNIFYLSGIENSFYRDFLLIHLFYAFISLFVQCQLSSDTMWRSNEYKDLAWQIKNQIEILMSNLTMSWSDLFLWICCPTRLIDFVITLH